MLRNDPIVAAYPLFLLGLPLSLKWRWYPSLLAVPLWRNRRKRPVRVVVDHLWFATGVLRELGSSVTAGLRRSATRRARTTPGVLVLPRSSNPYQNDLYGAMAESRSLTVRYLGDRTPSQTLNVLLLPLELAVFRLAGCRVLHVHWVYSFGLDWAEGRLARRAIEWSYASFLRVAVALGFKIVWTAHNVVPHERVFDDDVVARQELVRRCHAVIAHSEATASIVRGWNARAVEVVPAGVARRRSSASPDRAAACAALGLDPALVRVLFFGMVREYKGVDLLLEAVSLLPREIALDIVIVGECDDGALRARLESMAAAAPVRDRVRVRFEFLSEADLTDHLAASDFAVFPFRSVTSSSSVGHALAEGRPVIIPALAFLDDVPAEAAIRYDAGAGVHALAGALARAASTGADERARMQRAATRFANGRTWPDAAAATWRIFDDLLAGTEPAPRVSALASRSEVGE
jgi:glycosyltransferase involved in cell wall biosynthesis